MAGPTRRNVDDYKPSNVSLLLSLALFIMLLGFFIVMNSISTFQEQKIRPVTQSLEGAFGRVVVSGESGPSLLPDQRVSAGSGDALEEIGGLFRAEIAGIKVNMSKARGTMHVRVPLQDFTRAIDAISSNTLTMDRLAATPAGDNIPFMQTLVSVLTSSDTRRPYRMDIVMNVGKNPVALKREKPDIFAQYAARAGDMARRLEKAGMPTSQMSVGLAEGEADTVDLFFGLYKPYIPLKLEGGGRG